MAYSVFRVPNSITVLPTTGNQIVATIQGASGQSADLQQWQDYLGNIISRIDSAGNHSGVSGTFSGNVAVNGGSVTTSSTTANLFNSATTLNLGTASTNVYIGSVGTTNVNNLTATGTINANNGTIATNQTTANLLNTTATTVNAFGVATTTNIGAAGGTVNIGGTTAVNILTATGTINANGGTIATNQTTANLLNTNATTVNAFGAATTTNISTGSTASGVVNINTNSATGTINIGSATSNTYIAGNLYVAGQTVTVNSTQISTSDLFLNLGSGVGAVGAPLTGAGLILGSGTAGNGLGVKFTYNYNAGTPYWSSTENMSLATGKTYMINGTTVLSSTTLGSSVNISSLQQVGTIATGVWNGSVIGTGYTTAQVTAVTAGATNTISVTGTTQAPYINLATVTLGTSPTALYKTTVDAYGRISNTGVVSSGDIPNLSATQITNGTLAVAQGGTNLSSYTTGSILYGSGTTISQLTPGTSTYFLRSNGAGAYPSYQALSSGDITGALGYTPTNASSALTGTGSANKLAIWSSTTAVTFDNELVYDSTNNILSIGCLNLTAPTGDAVIGTAVTALDSWSATTYRSAKYLVQTKNSGNTIFQISEALVITDGTNAYLTEYGQIYTSGTTPLITLSADVSGGNVRLLVSGASANNSIRFVKTMITN